MPTSTLAPKPTPTPITLFTPAPKPDAQSYFVAGLSFAEQGRYQEAVAEYSEAIRLDPGNALAYNNRGLAYVRLGQYQRAIEDYAEAVRVDPGDADAYADRAVLHILVNDDKAAQREAERVVELGYWGSLSAPIEEAKRLR